MANDNKPNSNNFKVSPWLVYAAILLIFLTINFFTGGSNEVKKVETLAYNSSR